VTGPPSLPAAEINAAARALIGARAGGRQIPTPSLELIDTTDAYRIQDAVASLHGEIHGWKVGAKSPFATPTCAPLLSGTVSDAANGAGTDFSASAPLGIELEIAYRLGRDFQPGAPVSDQDVLDAVASAHIAVELCTSRLADGSSANSLWVLADNQMNERLIVGPPLQSWRALDSHALAARIGVDGETLVDTVGGHPAGEPLWLLVWLVRHCVEHRGGLRSGQIITTGSWTGMPTVHPPAQVTAEFRRMASLTFAIAEARP
jgi:2-keto-4-pentenoate hydratase